MVLNQGKIKLWVAG